MKVTRRKQRLLWLFRPEDSSSLETESVGLRSGSQDKRRIIQSILKVLVCYTMAITVTFLLSRLH